MKALTFNCNYIIYPNGKIYSNYRGIYLIYSVDNTGYNRVNLWDSDNSKTKKFLVHRLLAETFIPNPKNLTTVNHINGNKLDNSLGNLEWVSSGDNQRHAYNTGLKTVPKGENNGRAIRSEDEVLQIYQELLSGKSNKSVAEKYGVKGGLISEIKSKKAWNHILKDLPNCIIKPKREPLQEDLVIKVCEYVSAGYMPKIIKVFLEDEDITIDQISDIKRKRCFRKISKKYF